jgi:hypothetical protein
VRPIGRVTFLCWHKEKSPKECAFPDRAKQRSEAWPGFSDSPSMARSENGAHPVRRPSGLDLSKARMRRERATARKQQQLLFRFSLDPKGGRHGCRPFSDETWMSRQKIRNALSACRTPAVSRKALSLVTFFVPAKKVTRPRSGRQLLLKTQTRRTTYAAASSAARSKNPPDCRRHNRAYSPSASSSCA